MKIVSKEDFPYVLDWSTYVNVNSKLLCRCQNCGVEIYKTLDKLKRSGACYCKPCSVKCKTEVTVMNKYGHKNVFQSHAIKKKCKETKTERYGDPHYVNPDKCKETVLKKYDGKHVLQLEENRLKNKNALRKERVLDKRFETKQYNFLNNQPERDLIELLEKHDVECYKKRFEFGEVDIYIPSLNIGIEYNGMYWHSDDKLGRNYHLTKQLRAAESGITLYNIWECDYLLHPEIIRSWLTNLVHKTPFKIYGRKCVVRNVSKDGCCSFYNETHAQGGVPSRLQQNIGLFVEEEMVACMSFARYIRGGEDDWELTRYSTKLYTNVVGGFNKLLNYFTQNYKWNAVYTLSDNSYSQGNVYKKAGFVLDRDGKPDYFYYKPGIGRVDKRRLQKKVYDNPKELTEYQLNADAGYMRIYDCGHRRWLLKNPGTMYRDSNEEIYLESKNCVIKT